MSATEQMHFVWATFPTEAEALAAGKALRNWDKESDDVRFGDIGVLHLSDKGKLKVKRFDAPSSGKGALIGIMLGGLAALVAPLSLIVAATVGGLTGELVDSFHQKGLGLNSEQKSQIKSSLEAGKGLVVMLVNDFEVGPAKTRLAELGGQVDSAAADAANFSEHKALGETDLVEDIDS